jgi:hypothetical protein
MGGQPGNPKPPGNPPVRPEPQEPNRYRSRRHRYRFLQWRDRPHRSGRIGYFARQDERPGAGVKPTRRNYPWAGAVCSDAPVNFCATSVAAP